MVATLFQGQSIDRKKSKKIHQDDPITPESSLQNKTKSCFAGKIPEFSHVRNPNF